MCSININHCTFGAFDATVITNFVEAVTIEFAIYYTVQSELDLMHSL